MMKKLFSLLVGASLLTTAFGAEDARREPLKDLNGYFPFNPPAKWEDWTARRDYVRRQILVSQGLWPMPTKTPLNAVHHGTIDRGSYIIEKVYFESAPGLFVTGNLYRPKSPKGKVPVVLLTHGHRVDARFHLDEPEVIQQKIAIGSERFENTHRSMYQSMCHQLAQMGCVVWQWDMLSDSDAIQFSSEIVHKFANQRLEMSDAKRWGFYSAPAELRLQSIMGLHTWNAVRSLDFVLSLPEVDPERTAITGASGGGTQAMLLAAIDDRVQLSFPVVMVSTAMQGGCSCENACLLRVNSGNVEFAALFAPKPQGMNSADDWTKEMATKGFPELQKLYSLRNAKSKLMLQRGEIFPHAYNAVTRTAFYGFINQHFKLGFETPILEKDDFELLSREQLTVWNETHPAPKAADPEFEKQLLTWLDEDARKQLNVADKEVQSRWLKPALEVQIGRGLDDLKELSWTASEEEMRKPFKVEKGHLEVKDFQENVEVEWHQRLTFEALSARTLIVTLDDEIPELKAGQDGMKVKLYEEVGQDSPLTRVVKNPREVASFTQGYNASLFAKQTHDLLAVIQWAKQSGYGTIELVSGPKCSAQALAARALAGEAVASLKVHLDDFRFAQITDYRDPKFLPGAVKYGDVEGLVALNASYPTEITSKAETSETLKKLESTFPKLKWITAQ